MAKRCAWAKTELSIAYHDNVWGRPEHDDRVLFEFITLEGAQAGLSWETILKKQEGYRAAFADWDIAKVARYDARKRAALLKNPAIVRNKLKVESTVANAKAMLKAIEEFGSFDTYIWEFVDGKPIVNKPRRMSDLPAETDVSKAMSKALKKRGFRFVGPTICYAFMQATGMVNDHVIGCPARKHCR